MKALTEKQKKILDFIEEFMEREGMAPTVYEIADSFSIKTSTVFAHIRALQRKKQLQRSSKARSIALTDPKRSKPKFMSFVLPVPLLGRINAGLPAESLEYKEGEIYCSTSIVNRNDANKFFALKVQGESMRDLGIFEEDIIIVRQKPEINPGDIVVALVDGEVTVKSYYPKKGGRIELRPANEEFMPQVYPASKIKIQGVVVALQREY